MMIQFKFEYSAVFCGSEEVNVDDEKDLWREEFAKACNFSSNLPIGPDLPKTLIFSTTPGDIKIFVDTATKFEH